MSNLEKNVSVILQKISPIELVMSSSSGSCDYKFTFDDELLYYDEHRGVPRNSSPLKMERSWNVRFPWKRPSKGHIMDLIFCDVCDWDYQS